MITGPSVGPAMVLNILMRWPALIVVCGVGGTGAFIYNNVPEVQAAVHRGKAEETKTVEAPVPTVSAPMTEGSGSIESSLSMVPILVKTNVK